jgi:hypothetical protein
LRRGGVTFVDIVRALNDLSCAAPLHLVKRGAHAFRNDTPRPGGAGAWGLALVAGLEPPEIPVKIVDMDMDRDVAALWAELCRADRGTRSHPARW